MRWLGRLSSRVSGSRSSASRQPPPTLPHGPAGNGPASGSQVCVILVSHVMSCSAHVLMWLWLQRSQQQATAPPLPAPSQEQLTQLLEMGFDAASASRALQLSNNNIESALQHLT